jgi:hypothetical protein
MAVGEPCEEVGASGCSDQGDVLLCVDEAWSLQESCEFGVEECAASKGVAVCSVGGEPCDEEGATKCDDSFTVVQCDGAGWHVYDDCFPDSCSTDAGSASCVAR